MADDSLDRLKTANPYIAHVKLDDRYSNSSTWCVYVRDPRWPADRCSGLYGEDDRWRESLRKKTGTGRGKCFKNDCNGRICVTLPPIDDARCMRKAQPQMLHLFYPKHFFRTGL